MSGRRRLAAVVAFALGMASGASAQLNGGAKNANSCWTGLVGGPLWQMRETWSDGDTIRSTVTFRSDGVMVYSYNGMTYDNARWTVTGSQLRIDTNNHFADYDGVIAGNVAHGQAKNTRGETASWTLWRDCAAK